MWTMWTTQRKKFISHIDAYFRDGGVFEEFRTFKRVSSIKQLFYFDSTTETIDCDLRVRDVLCGNRSSFLACRLFLNGYW